MTRLTGLPTKNAHEFGLACLNATKRLTRRALSYMTREALCETGRNRAGKLRGIHRVADVRGEATVMLSMREPQHHTESRLPKRCNTVRGTVPKRRIEIPKH